MSTAQGIAAANPPTVDRNASAVGKPGKDRQGGFGDLLKDPKAVLKRDLSAMAARDATTTIAPTRIVLGATLRSLSTHDADLAPTSQTAARALPNAVKSLAPEAAPVMAQPEEAPVDAPVDVPVDVPTAPPPLPGAAPALPPLPGAVPAPAAAARPTPAAPKQRSEADVCADTVASDKPIARVDAHPKAHAFRHEPVAALAEPAAEANDPPLATLAPAGVGQGLSGLPETNETPPHNSPDTNVLPEASSSPPVVVQPAPVVTQPAPPPPVTGAPQPPADEPHRAVSTAGVAPATSKRELLVQMAPTAATLANTPPEPESGSNRPQPAPVAPVAPATPVASPQGFRSELTVAAANYALVASSRLQPAAPPAAVSEADARQPRSDPLPTPRVRITSGPVAHTPVASTPVVTTALDNLRQTVAQASDAPAPLAASADVKTAATIADERSPLAASGVAVSARAETGMPQAPAPVVPAPTSAPVIAAIVAEPSWRAGGAALLQHSAQLPPAVTPKTLSIQLHPAELGVVTATLRLVGNQLSVEIAAETDDARIRLSADSHAIARSLRELGLDVDHVTVVAQSTASPTPARIDDVTAANAAQPRDNPSFGGANSGGGNGRLGGQQSGRTSQNVSSNLHDTGTPAAERGNSGLYI